MIDGLLKDLEIVREDFPILKRRLARHTAARTYLS